MMSLQNSSLSPRTLIILVLLLAGGPFFSLSPSDLLVLGGVESVVISPPGILFDARIDTGAELSSINGFSVQEFIKEDDLWVRFQISNNKDPQIQLERPVKRFVMVRQGSFDAQVKRYIVELEISLGDLSVLKEFSLADRRHMSYPVLIGRNVLSGNALVDVSAEYLLNP